MKQLPQPKKGRLYTLVLLLAMTLSLMVMISKCSHSHDRSPLASVFTPGTGDTINVAIEMNPAVYSVRGDSVTGRDYELLREISERFGRPMKFYPFVPLARAVEGLANGEFDILVASLPLTTELKEQYLMTEPVYLDREILVQRSDSLIRSQLDLGGDTVWITEDSPFRSRLDNMSDEIGDTIYVRSSPEFSSEALFILVAKGRIKYAVINEGIARALAPQYPDVDIATPVSFTQFQSWALRSDNQALCDSLNRWISIINAER